MFRFILVEKALPNQGELFSMHFVLRSVLFLLNEESELSYNEMD